MLRVIAAYRRAKNVADAWHETVFDPASTAYQAARAAVPHYTTKASFENTFGKMVHMSTGCRTSEAVIVTSRRDHWTYQDDDFGRCCTELGEALDRRNAQLEQIDAEWLARGLNQQSDALGDKWFAAFSEVYAYPVRTVEDLTLKIETVRSVDEDPYDIDILVADLNRISGRF
ncbi:hypothetical protein [Novosphingobium sp. 9U]|uniref:hypothetical protein n=1 Tax=Novosphingobium sp. 9U TaxID=2653158 RepID=UPI001F2A9F23|nr:hypothetical protein [Novosphingobium sp. 9U]